MSRDDTAEVRLEIEGRLHGRDERGRRALRYAANRERLVRDTRRLENLGVELVREDRPPADEDESHVARQGLEERRAERDDVRERALLE
jgi:hypothetical protein